MIENNYQLNNKQKQDQVKVFLFILILKLSQKIFKVKSINKI
jgi:hypothetical protein